MKAYDAVGYRGNRLLLFSPQLLRQGPVLAFSPLLKYFCPLLYIFSTKKVQKFSFLAPSSRVISMNTSIKIVDEYFGNYSTITFKADNGTLEFTSNFNFTCNFCSYGIFYIYDSDNLNNLLYM
jgi:hypothetical protein